MHKQVGSQKQQSLELSIALGLFRPEPKSRERLLPRGRCPRVTFVTMPRTCRQNMNSDTHTGFTKEEMHVTIQTPSLSQK